MANGVTTHHEPAAALPIELPRSDALRMQLLDAVLLASALVCEHRNRIPPAARMLLLREVHQSGLAGTPPGMDILASFDTWLTEIKNPVRTRRLLARRMDPFVGSPWAAMVLRIAGAVATVSGSATQEALVALDRLRLSLGQCGTADCLPRE